MTHRRAALSTISQPCSASWRRCCFWSRSSVCDGRDVVVGGQEEAAGAAGRVADGLPGLGLHDVDHGLDQRARREVLAGARS